MPEVAPAIETFARIKVIGVGGAGGAAVNRMVEAGVEGVEFIAINTDAQALHHSKASVKVHIGRETTKGLGAGADPAVGRNAADESADDIKKVLDGADMVFVTFGAGGGTGSGAGPVIARLANDLDILVVGIATKPFAFEGEKRRRNADEAIDGLSSQVDTLITIPNDRLLQTIDRRTPLMEAFKVADDVLRQGVQGISDLITVNGMINLDFADVKAVMSNAGSALMGIGRAAGENRSVAAAQQAIESPLLEVSIDGARGVLFNITGSSSMAMHEINEAAETITGAVDPEANIIFGATLDESMGDDIAITVIATGFEASYYASRSVARPRASASLSSDDESTAAALADDSATGTSAASAAGSSNSSFSATTSASNSSSSSSASRSASKDDDIPTYESFESVVEKSAGKEKITDHKPDTSIWSYEQEDKYEKPSFLRLPRRKKKDDSSSRSSDSSKK